MMAVDAMHCLLEGLAQFHFRVVLGLTEAGVAAAAKNAETPYLYTFSSPTPEYAEIHLKGKSDMQDVAAIHRTLLKAVGKIGDTAEDDAASLDALKDQLHKRTKAALAFVVQSLDLNYNRNDTKFAYAMALRTWVS